MKKLALAMLILALAIPAMADVEITISNDANIVTIGYNNTGGEMVRAFPLEIAVSGEAYIVGSDVPDANDYYVYPTNMTFTVVDGNTVIDQLGSPIAEADANGGILEMASLYAANDPLHPAAPPASGTLVSFAVDCAGGDVTVTIAENGKRGGVVLEDPDVDPTVTLPAPLVVVCGGTECLVVGQVCGGITITQAMYDNWVTIGKDASWCFATHFAGDANMDCKVNAADILSGPNPNYQDSFGSIYPAANYRPSCDHNNDLKVNAADIISSIPGAGLQNNFGTIFTLPPDCP
jgi:hypothetical protein